MFQKYPALNVARDFISPALNRISSRTLKSINAFFTRMGTYRHVFNLIRAAAVFDGDKVQEYGGKFVVAGANTLVDCDPLKEVFDFEPLAIKVPMIPSRRATPRSRWICDESILVAHSDATSPLIVQSFRF